MVVLYCVFDINMCYIVFVIIESKKIRGFTECPGPGTQQS